LDESEVFCWLDNRRASLLFSGSGRRYAMAFVIMGLQVLLGLVSLVCLILVLVKMFQNGQTGLGVVCIVLCLCGIGVLVTFIVGWVNANRWGIMNVMIAWTIVIVIGILLNLVALAIGQPMVIPGR
jgi:hypothetical protein